MDKVNIMNNKKIAKVCGINWGKNMFNDFINHPEYKGKNFSWNIFPEMASKYASINFDINIYPKPKNMKELKQICFNSCFKTIKQLIKKNKLL